MLILMAAGWLSLFGALMAQELMAQELVAQEADGQELKITSSSRAQIGFGGVVKLGKWVPVFIELDPGLKPTRFEIEAIDGDETPVTYSGLLLSDPSRPHHYQAWVRFGRVQDKIRIELFNASDERIEVLELTLQGESADAGFQDSTRELILTLEPGELFSEAIAARSNVADRDKARITIPVGRDDELPLNWLGYDEVKTILLVTSDEDRLRQFSNAQIDGLELWVRNGGTLILSAAKNSQELFSNEGILERFAPGVFEEPTQLTSSKRLETYADSREHLIPVRGEPIPISKFSKLQGTITLTESTSAPLIIRRAFGMGKIVFVTFDLDSDRLTQWKGFPNLVARLVSPNGRRGDEQKSQRVTSGNSVSHYGFEDIVGQLRVPLDQFSSVKFVTFAWVALLIGIYILCIGPGDYFFLRKLFGRMELTWITFPLLSLLFCGLAIGISRMTRPNTIQLNQLEIIDIDVVAGRTRGSVWTNLYSPSGGAHSVEYDVNHELGFSIDADLISWHGLPGEGLGGMKTRMNPGLVKSKYQQRFELSDNGQDWHAVLEELPLQVASTRPLFGQWWSDNPVRIRSRLRFNPRLQQISGTITNPFDFTLKNCRLVFENWAYILDQPLEPGQTIDIQTETTEKTLKHLLTRKTKKTEKEDRSHNSPWDIRDTRINRIADMMMFYQAAGGNTYTGLTHDYQGFTDMTDHLELKRAMLVGEADSVGSVLSIDGKRMSAEYDRTVTILRIILPVQFVDGSKQNP